MLVYRSKIDFCMLVLHPAILLNLFIILYIFYGIFRMIYIKDVICKHKEFYFFSCLDIFFLPNCSARISRTMLNRTDESGHLSLFLIFEEKFTVFLMFLHYWVGHLWVFYTWSLLCWSIFLLLLVVKYFLSQKGVKFCQMLSFYLLRHSYNFYLLFFLCSISHWCTGWFHILNNPCIPGINISHCV